MYRTRPWSLQQQLLLWASVVAVALGLLAMHHMSRNHVAADPLASSHPQAEILPLVGPVDPIAGSDTANHAQLQPTGSNKHHPAEAGDACPGCAAHSAMMLTCLAALTLMAVGWLLRTPLRGPGLLIRPLFRAVLSDQCCRRRPPTLSLMELSVSRT